MCTDITHQKKKKCVQILEDTVGIMIGLIWALGVVLSFNYNKTEEPLLGYS